MTMHMGSVPAGTTLYVPFATYGKTNGESITLTGLAVTDIEIYKNGSVTQRASDAGYALLDTDGIDFDGITGIHGFSIDLSDNTDSGFYAVGSWYWVVVSAVTVDSQTVNFIAATFRIAPAEGITGYPKVDVHAFAGTAATASGGRPEVNATHFAGTAYATALAAEVDAVWDEALSGHATAGTSGKAVSDILTDTGTDIPATLTTIAGYIDTEVAAIKAVTDNLPNSGALTTITTHLTDIKGATFSGATDSLEAIRDRGDAAWITATGFSTLDAAGVRAAVGLASANLDTQLTAIDDYLDTEVAAIKAKTDLIPASPAAVSDIPSAATIASTVLAAGDIDGYSLEGSLKLIGAATAGKLSGAATTTVTIRAMDDSKARITATVDADGNRSAVTLDATG